MHPAELTNYWWVFPLGMIALCVVMCLFARQRGDMGCCCMGWRGSGNGTKRSIPEPDHPRSERTAATDKLKQTFDGLNRRVQNLEDAVTAKEVEWERRLNRP